ncbi:HEAT repeat domain-containing protein [Phytomonospora sp. NPDC050363]|uniref:HEAT repeat domain-containing protein n=1 Tax=Phytomonospora sp. NPDC050363 TaxID=3155642 RepID=UPI0033DA60C1
MSRRFRDAMRLMRKHDPQLAEDGFWALAPVAGEHVAELMEEFAVEKDRGLRCWLLELVEKAKSPDAFEFLAAQLRSGDDRLEFWAVEGLRLLDTKPARRMLWEWGQRPPANEAGKP